MTMMSQKEARLSYQELRHIVLVCSKCQAEECLDLTGDIQMESLVPGGDLVPHCGICETPINRDLVQAIRSLRDAYRKLESSGCALVFRVPASEFRK
jgi:hypothetical protein